MLVVVVFISITAQVPLHKDDIFRDVHAPYMMMT